MPKNNIIFENYKVSERKRDGSNKRTVFYLTPKDERYQNIDEYSEKYLIAIKRDYYIERYPECIPNTVSVETKVEITNYLKDRNAVLEKQKDADFIKNKKPNTCNTGFEIQTDEQVKVADFDVFEDIF